MIEQLEQLNIPNFEIYIFDMDGTLYTLDGDGGSFYGSSLMSKIICNSINFVAKKENCGIYNAKKIIENARKDKVGISRALADRYNLTRTDIFENTWNINPENIIQESPEAINALTLLNASNKKLILVTSAPKIWMDNVLSKLNINNFFERKISGENFQTKADVFESLSKEFDPNSIISIGDQIETDIMPARKFGISTFLVNNPSDLMKLI